MILINKKILQIDELDVNGERDVEYAYNLNI